MTNRVIPAGIRRRVRQELGFGCVICGCPIYDYDHIEEFSIVKEHESRNLVLLCPTHHREKGNNLLSIEKIQLAKAEAKSRKWTSNHAIEVGHYLVDIGGNRIVSLGGGVFDICGFGYFLFDQNSRIHAAFFDESGAVVLKIVESEYQLSSDVWDIESSGGAIVFRKKLRDVFLKIDIDANSKIISVTGKVEIDGSVLELRENGFFVNRKKLATGNFIHSCGMALLVTDKRLNFRAMFGGGASMSNCLVVGGGVTDAAVMNCDVSHTSVNSCRYGFVWNTQYLTSFGDS